MSEYPEHDKLSAVKEESQAIGEFIENGGYTLCKWRDAADCNRFIDKDTGESRGLFEDGAVPNPEWYPEGFYPEYGTQRILAGYFEIDLAVIDAEKQAMLAKMRATNT